MRDFIAIACVLLAAISPGCANLGGGGAGKRLAPLLTVGEYRMIVATMLAEIRVLGDAGDGGSQGDRDAGDSAGSAGSAAPSTPAAPPQDPPSSPRPPQAPELSPPQASPPPSLPPQDDPPQADSPEADAPQPQDDAAPEKKVPCDSQSRAGESAASASKEKGFSFTFDGMRYTLDSLPDPGQLIQTPRATFIVREDASHSTGRRVEVFSSDGVASGSASRPYESGDEVTYARRPGYVEPKYGTFDYPFPDVWTHLRSHHRINADHLSRREAERLHDSLH